MTADQGGGEGVDAVAVVEAGAVDVRWQAGVLAAMAGSRPAVEEGEEEIISPLFRRRGDGA
jgi:hypothetical protein